FATRDAYRHVVERLARMGTHSEQEVARAAVELAREAAASDTQDADPRHKHVGYYLLDRRGLARLERVLEVRRPWLQRLRGFFARAPPALYLRSVALSSVGVALVPFAVGHFATTPLAGQIPLGCFCLSAATAFAVPLV